MIIPVNRTGRSYMVVGVGGVLHGVVGLYVPPVKKSMLVVLIPMYRPPCRNVEKR
jgi:hypothetical protein